MSTEPGLRHLDDEALILHQLGDDDEAAREAARRHLASCESCREQLDQIGDVLAMVSTSAPPAAPEGFERVMWARVSARLDAPRGAGWAAWFTWSRLAMAGGTLAVVMAAFVVGRWTREPAAVAPVEVLVKLAPETALLLAASDHFERAQMTLAEVLHADAGDAGLAAERARAADLVAASRLIRQSVSQAGDLGMADVLEDLERVLLEIANRADGWSPGELEAFKARLDEGGMLFRLRVVSAEMRERRERRAAPTT
jgi:predicted anti-sigma-YlaC factor YlaD